MSVYIYLECKDHDPPLQSEDEVGQRLHALPTIREWIAADRENLPDWTALWNFATGGPDYFGSRAVRFLEQHVKCRIGIRDEYGDEYPVEVT